MPRFAPICGKRAGRKAEIKKEGRSNTPLHFAALLNFPATKTDMPGLKGGACPCRKAAPFGRCRSIGKKQSRKNKTAARNGKSRLPGPAYFIFCCKATPHEPEGRRPQKHRKAARAAGVKTAGARANKAAAQRLGTAAAQSALGAKQNGPGQRSFSIEKATGRADGCVVRFIFPALCTA